jgi:hypothetical protein
MTWYYELYEMYGVDSIKLQHDLDLKTDKISNNEKQ